MNNSFQDLISLGEMLGQQPVWYDIMGVPRFLPFHPSHTANTNAIEVMLVQIVCTHCGKEFNMALSSPLYPLTEDIVNGYIDCDPPFHNCPGDTTTADAIKVLEFWRNYRLTGFAWRRYKKMEVYLGDHTDMHPNYLDLQKERVRL